MSPSKKPYYGKKTKARLVEDYFKEAITMTELSELHGLLGSNTAADWIRKYGHLYKPKVQSTMNTNIDTKLSKADKKKKRKKRQRSYEQNQISDLEQLLDMTKTRLSFYRCALEVINELALELTQIDLLKKTGRELSIRRAKKKS